MKKILSMLVVCAMIFALSACANSSGKDGESSTPTDSMPVGTEPLSDDPATGDATEPSELEAEGYSWECKDVTLPAFEELEVRKMVVMQYEGSDITGNVVVSPLSLEDYDPIKTMEAVKQSPLFAGWTFGFEECERGDVIMYTDVGQQTDYKWQKSIVASKDYYDTESYFSDLHIQYTGETENAIGYTDIRVEIELHETELTSEVQSQVYDVLKAVYGEKYAEVLCYGKIEQENIICEQELDNAAITFRRNVSDDGSLDFILNINTYARSTFDGYGGSGDYKPLVTTPEYFDDIFSEDFGTCDVSKYAEIGAKMLSENYADYTGTVPGYTSGYYYRVLNCDNGHKVVNFSLDGMVGQEEVGKLVLPDFKLEYEVVSANGTVTVKEGSLYCGVGLTGDGADADATREDMLARAVKMIDCLFDESIDLSNELIFNEETKEYNVVEKTLNILGSDTNVAFTFEFGETMADTFVGYINVDF